MLCYIIKVRLIKKMKLFKFVYLIEIHFMFYNNQSSNTIINIKMFLLKYFEP